MADDTAQRFPLTWPTTWKRTPAHLRRRAAFHGRKRLALTNGGTYSTKEALSIGAGLGRLTGELRRLGARQVIISSNLRTRVDGLPYAVQAKNLDDPGVAVYFNLQGKPRVLACDKWLSAAENMAAIAGHIAAIRAQERYGVGTIDQAFAGYAALPPSAVDWWLVLGIDRTASRDAIIAAHRRLAMENHPDKGGRLEDMARINAARDMALQSLAS
jgi:DnaJ domain